MDRITDRPDMTVDLLTVDVKHQPKQTKNKNEIQNTENIFLVNA